MVTNPKVAKAAFTGSTATGRMVMQYATENIIPVTLELGGKSPNVFPSVMDADDEFLDKAVEGAVFLRLIKVKFVLVLLDYWFMNLLQLINS